MKRVMQVLKYVFVLLMLVAGVAAYRYLPEIIPTHWNFAGEADGFGPKATFVWLFPGIAIAVLILFWFLPKIDPKKDKYKKFAEVWEIMQAVLVGYFAYMYFVSLYAAVVPDVNVSAFVLVGVGVLFLILGNYMGKIRQNYFVGIKTPWTIENEDVWNKTHRFGGWCFVIAALIFVLQGLTGFVSIWLFGLAIVVAALLPILYSYWIFPRNK